MLLQIVLALPLLILVEYFIYRQFLLRGMTYRRSISQSTAFEGEKVYLVEEIENNSLLPIAWMKAESKISPRLKLASAKNMEEAQEGYHRSVFSIMPYYRIKRTHEVTCLQRGDYNVGNVTITSGDILGLTTKITSYENETRLIVYPSPLNNDRLVNCFRSLQGDAVVRRFINPDPFIVAGVREYRPGDPMSAISWKATARTNSLQVFKYDFTANSNILILFNIDTSSKQDRFPNEEQCRQIEFGIHFCAAILEKAIKQGTATGFCTNGHFRDSSEFVNIPARCSKPQLYTVLEALAKLQFDRSLSFYTLLRNLRGEIPRDTDILIVSLYSDESIEEEILYLRREGRQVEVMLIQEGGVF
ncbi:hypothetical protein CLHUN_33770 [Ruminiclostridium hungatei]|uniref:DUF58 domain-containing protein n=1 Tax=Ruminiclostridium hungatei TaxID=48256 RepID=A0A1V4SGY5_RUMHU|nr:DUF58 domain-containing protein [Ruminiclostridium hungatei]OPX42725.1 hypothetical protein CLHUN_33770 [Ruminiclostridium hungatei]